VCIGQFCSEQANSPQLAANSLQILGFSIQMGLFQVFKNTESPHSAAI